MNTALHAIVKQVKMHAMAFHAFLTHWENMHISYRVRYRSNVTSHSLAIFPWVKWLLDRVTSGSSGKLRKHSTRYTSVVESRGTTCLRDMRTRKTGSVEDASCIIRGAWDLYSCFRIFYAQAQAYRLNIV